MDAFGNVTWTQSLRLIWEQAPLAGASAAVFVIGFASAWVVVRSDIRFLIRPALWFLNTILSLVRRRRTFLFILCLIFGFNGTAMLLYMLSGIVPFLPAAICFLTGMNIAVAMLKGHTLPGVAKESPAPAEPMDGTLSEDASPAVESRPGQGCFLAICFLLVAALELPCFWLAIALGTSMEFSGVGRLTQAGMLQVILPRVVAYLEVILPVLGVSAAIEALAIRQTLGRSA